MWQYYGSATRLESISYLGSRLWEILSKNQKFSIFNENVKVLKGESCNCSLCKNYLSQVDFLENS